MVFYGSLSPSTPTSRNSFLGWTPTCIASSIMRVFQLQQCARAARLLRLSGGALTASLHLCSARSVAENPTGSFPSTGFRSGQGHTLFNHGCGRHDKEGNPMMTIIDRSGVHEIGVSWCSCPEAPERDLQLMMAGLFPATFHNPKTAFTFRVLEEFHLDNLECKTTPSQFFSRLRRLTNDEFPNAVPVGGFSAIWY
jgi:hypothetical protein